MANRTSCDYRNPTLHRGNCLGEGDANEMEWDLKKDDDEALKQSFDHVFLLFRFREKFSNYS